MSIQSCALLQLIYSTVSRIHTSILELALSNTNITTNPANSLPHPLTQPILQQSSEHHQIPRTRQQVLTDLRVRPTLLHSQLSIRQHLPVPPNTRDRPEEQGTNVARDSRRKGVEMLCGVADGRDGAVSIKGKEVERVDSLLFISVRKMEEENGNVDCLRQ